jgi:hypothetical protein
MPVITACFSLELPLHTATPDNIYGVTVGTEDGVSILGDCEGEFAVIERGALMFVATNPETVI